MLWLKYKLPLFVVAPSAPISNLVEPACAKFKYA
jgi:hypothetical protein